MIGPQDVQMFIIPISIGFFESSFQISKKYSVSCFCLSIKLRVLYRGVVLFDLKFFQYTFQYLVYELLSTTHHKGLEGP